MNCRKLSVLRILFAILSISVVSVMIFGTDTAANSTKRTVVQPGQQESFTASKQEQANTPLQQALKVTIEERRQAGLPGPKAVSYHYEISDTSNKNRVGTVSKQTVIITGTTVLDLSHPEQAGLDKWPDLVITDTLPTNATGFIVSGDYTQAVRDELEAAFPGIWDQYEFGYEPRRYTFKETFTVTYHQDRPQVNMLASGSISSSGVAQELVMGFTTSGPRIDYTIEEKWEECVVVCVTLAEAKAGFELDWDIGFRLPLAVSLITSRPMRVGSSNPMAIAITSLDWSAQQFQQVGLDPVGGKEFLLQYIFFMGAKATILGVDVVDWALDAEYDASKSFATPIGLGASFPLPTLDLSPDATGLNWTIGIFMSVGVGLSIDPHLEMGGITAEWQAVPGSDASGNGSITYNATGGPVTFGSVIADDFSPTTSYAHIRLSSFRYRFNEFMIELGGFLQFELFGYGVKSGTFHIRDFDLSDVSDGQWLNPHTGTNATVEDFILVTDVPPVYIPIITHN